MKNTKLLKKLYIEKGKSKHGKGSGKLIELKNLIHVGVIYLKTLINKKEKNWMPAKAGIQFGLVRFAKR